MLVLELVVNGLVEGSLLALICIGYSLAYGTAGVVNFAHADLMIAGGGYLVLLWVAGPGASELAAPGMAALFGAAAGVYGWTWRRPWGRRAWGPPLTGLFVATACGTLVYFLAGALPFWCATLLAIPMTAALATAVYRASYEPLIRTQAPRMTVLIAALAMSIALQSLLLILWGSQRRVYPPQALPPALVARSVPEALDGIGVFWDYGSLQIGESLRVPLHDVLIVATFASVAIALALFYRLSRTADAIVATADSRLAARACGIPVDAVLAHAFFLGGAVASLGGTLYVLRAKSLHPTSGFSVGVIAFVACVLGGIGSLRGSVIGAFSVALIASLAPAVPLQQWAERWAPEGLTAWLPSLHLSDWSYGVVYVLMILTILYKPRGLFTR